MHFVHMDWLENCIAKFKEVQIWKDSCVLVPIIVVVVVVVVVKDFLVLQRYKQFLSHIFPCGIFTHQFHLLRH